MTDSAVDTARPVRGRPLLHRYGKYLHLDEAKLQRADDFFARHGDKKVFVGRFVAVLRAWAAFLAGVNRMPWPKFLVFNAAGGICWAILYGTLAYELGSNLPLLHRLLRDLGLGSIVLAVAVVAVLVLLRRRARRFEHRPAAWERHSAAGQQRPRGSRTGWATCGDSWRWPPSHRRGRPGRTPDPPTGHAQSPR